MFDDFGHRQRIGPEVRITPVMVMLVTVLVTMLIAMLVTMLIAMLVTVLIVMIVVCMGIVTHLQGLDVIGRIEHR